MGPWKITKNHTNACDTSTDAKISDANSGYSDLEETQSISKSARDQALDAAITLNESDEKQRLVNLVMSKYKLDNNPPQINLVAVIYLQRYINQFIDVFGGINKIKGKRILDLGCGSTLTPPAKEYLDNAHKRKVDDDQIGSFLQLTYHIPQDLTWGILKGKRTYEPWLPRILHEAGANVTGIDIGNLADEEFEHYQLNLKKPGALKFLPDHSFDLIHSKLLFDSPTFILPSNYPLYHPLYSSESGAQERIEEEMKRLIKPDGIIISTQ